MNLRFERIQSDIKKKEIQQIWLAEKIGCSKESLTYYLQFKNKMKFYQYYILVSNVYTYESEQSIIQECLSDYINHTDKQENLKEALEWSLQNANHELFCLAISKVDKETSDIFNLLMLRNQKKVNGFELFEKVESLKVNPIKQKDMVALLYIISLYAYCDMKKYDLTTLHLKWTLKRVDKLKNGFIKEAFTIRVKELAAVSYLKENRILESMTAANEIIIDANVNLYPMMVNSMLNLMAELYVFTDPIKSIDYSERALRMFEEMNFTKYQYRKLSLQATHDFVKITNNKFENLYLSDPSEEAHYLAKQTDANSKKKATQILNDLDKRQPTSPHRLYYKFLATGSRDVLEVAKKEFYKSGDFFYCKLVEKV